MPINPTATLVLDAIPGTQDFYPEMQRVQQHLKRAWLKMGDIYGFEEYDSSVLDRDTPYKIKSGDGISSEMFQVFDCSVQEQALNEANGKAGLVLRPEMTQILARMVMARFKSLSPPLRWMAFPVCYRNETTQKGRKREFTQANYDIIGISDVTAEIELFSLIISIFKSLGFTSDDIVIRFSDRRLLETYLAKYGIPSSEFPKACEILDRIEKVTVAGTMSDLKELGVSDEDSEAILNTLKEKSLDSIASVLAENGTEHSLVTEIRKLQTAIADLGDWLVFDPSIVRGLAYYTGTVFEGFSKTTDIKRAVCGGGRYDNLLSIYDPSIKIPAIGFGMGDIIMVEMLKQLNLIPEDVTERRVDNFIFPYDSSFYPAAFKTANILRDAGQSVEVYLGQTGRVNVRSAYDHANSRGATRAIFIAPQEYENGTVPVKFMRQKSEDGKAIQMVVPLSDLAELPLVLTQSH